VNSAREYEAQLFNRINPAVRFSVTRYVLSIGIFVAIVTFGIVSMFGLGVDLLPAVNIPSVNISTSYSGASPGVVDQQVTQVIENAVSALSGITDMSSSSSIGSSRVTVSFAAGADRNAMVNQVAALVNATIRRLPSGVGSPVVRTFDPSSQPVIQFGIAGGGASLTDVAAYVQDSLSPSLEHVAGVANISVDGAATRQFQVLLAPNKLRFYSLTPTQVVNAIVASAVNQPIGSIISQNNSLTFATQNIPGSIEQIGRVLVDATRGISVTDLGTIRDASVGSNYARLNGMPVVLVSVQRTSDSNSVAVVDGVRKMLKSAVLPSGYTLDFGIDSTGPIRASIANTYHELVLSLIVVAIIVLLFLGKPDTAFSIILAIPIALSASPILYNIAGFSFNLVSLLAMVIAIGIVVDDSIVVAENVERYRVMGFGMKDAVLKGASEVFSAVVASTLSLLAVLLPVSFMGGYVGRYLQQFSLGLAAAVLFSLFEAVLFLTVRLAYTKDRANFGWKDFLGSFARIPAAFRWALASLPKALSVVMFLAAAGGLVYLKTYIYLPALLLWPLALGALNYFVIMGLSLFEAISGTLHDATEFLVGLIRDLYARSLKPMLRWSPLVLLVTVVSLGAVAFILIPQIPFSFVPQSDNGTLSVNVRFPPGTPQSVALAASAKVEAFLMAQPEPAIIQITVGGGASADVELVPVGSRPSVFLLTQSYRKALQPILKDIPSARVSVSAGGGQGGFGGTSLQLGMVCADFNLLAARNAAILGAIQDNPYVTDASSSLSDTNLQNDFIPDVDRLKGTGLTTQTIATTLQTYTTGVQASNVVIGGLAYPIMVKLDPATLSGGQSLLDLPIYSSSLQTSLQIGQLGRFLLNQTPVSLSRYNRQYTGTLTINLRPDAPSALEMQKILTADLAGRGLLDNGLSISVTSRTSSAALATEMLTTSPQLFLLALFLAYLVMAGQFNSWRYPIYLLLPVPLALTGALLIVFIVGGGIDIFGMMGMLMLIGLSSKNAILYLDFVVERMGTMPLEEALIEAAKLRFRPILMTTITTVVISFPLILSVGQGAEFGKRMGIVMFGGIVFSAVLTFFVVPAAFYFFERKRQILPVSTGENQVQPSEAGEGSV
jgi:HAE1 family hydrophobic/amphiphilic exporter-1